MDILELGGARLEDQNCNSFGGEIHKPVDA
jgi:hypothetical protein